VQRLERVERSLLHREIKPRQAAAPRQSISFSAFRSIFSLVSLFSPY
jgi:hypothetical protein